MREVTRLKVAEAQKYLLEGKSQQWIEFNVHIAYQTIKKARDELQQQGLWPPKPTIRTFSFRGHEYCDIKGYNQMVKEECDELIRTGQKTRQNFVDQKVLLPNGEVVPDESDFDRETFYICVDTNENTINSVEEFCLLCNVGAAFYNRPLPFPDIPAFLERYQKAVPQAPLENSLTLKSPV